MARLEVGGQLLGAGNGYDLSVGVLAEQPNRQGNRCRERLKATRRHIDDEAGDLARATRAK